MRISKLLSFTFFVILLWFSQALAAYFSGIGDLPGGVINSGASDVSADGSVVVGWGTSESGGEAFRWTFDGGIIGLGDLPGGSFNSDARDVSADGSVVVGQGRGFGGEAFLWTLDGGMVDLIPGRLGIGLGVSADGSVVVGVDNFLGGGYFEAFLWTSDGGMIGLGDLPGGDFYSQAFSVSVDGSVVVGRGYSDSGSEAFRWTSDGGMVGLGDLPGDNFYSVAHDVSADGSVVVGRGHSEPGGEAFRWTSDGGMVGLGDLPGGVFNSLAHDVSADGSVVVGRGTSESGDEAVIWDNTGEIQSLKDKLIALNFVEDLNEWDLREAAGISADGKTIVGSGTNPDGHGEAWIANISPVSIVGSLASFKTIQSAIDAANDGEVVLVEDGIYTGEGNINLDFKGKAITVRSRNGPDNCIIDCELNSGGVRFVSGETRNAKLDGFTIQNTSQEPEVGAAILIENSSPTISNCVITKCQDCGGPWTIGCIDFDNRIGIYGAVRINNSSPSIVGCAFSDNSLGSIEAHNSQITIIESNFFDNVTDYLYHHTDTLYLSNSTVLISKSEFIGNFSRSVIEASNCIFKMENSLVKNNGGGRGGILIKFRALKEGSELLHCNFINNSGDDDGDGAINMKNSFLHIFDCVFEENDSEYYAGAIGIYNSSTTIENCYFKSNLSLNGVGALDIYTDESYEFEAPKVLNTIFEGNTAYDFCIVRIDGSSIFTNCTFVGNNYNRQNVQPHFGLFFADASTLVSNSIFWNNIPRTFLGSIPSLSHCNIDQDGFAGTNGNISEPPSFISAENSDFHLSLDSPCKDTGDNNAPELPNTDMDDNPRIMDGIVDMGAYEYPDNQEPPVAYDMNISTDEDTPVGINLEYYDKDLIYEFSSDKSGNYNNFSANGDGDNIPEPSENHVEGNYSAYFERDNKEYLILDDVSAKVELPWKNGTLNKTGTVWLKFRTPELSIRQVMFGKYEINPEKKTFLISTTPSGEIQVNIGYNEGSSFKLHIHDSILNTGTWYAVGVCFEQNDGYSTDPERVHIKIRTVGDGNVVGTDYLANAFDDPDNEEISLDVAPYMIGAVFRSPSIRMPFKGYIDEVIMFKEKKFGSDFEQYATGSYSGESECLLDFEHTQLNFSIVSDPSDGTLSGTPPTITYTPDTNFFGDNSFTFKVNDGYVDSNIATVSIDVDPVNDLPVITGQLPLETKSGVALKITLADLLVNDTDNDYPEDFTLHVQVGDNYTLNKRTITPNAGFTGTLVVPVYVNDGTDDSDTYNLNITVKILANITSPASNKTINVGGSINFQCDVVGGTPPFIYLWTFDGAADNSTQQNPGDVIFSEVGTYTVTLSVADDDGDIDSDTVTITVEEESGGGGGGGGGGFCFISVLQ